MRQMLFGVMGLSMLGGAVLQIMPSWSRLVPYVRFLLALVLLLMMLTPLIDCFEEIPLADPTAWLVPAAAQQEYSQYWDEAVTGSATARAEASLAALISARTGIGVQDMTVTLTTVTERGDTETTVTVTAVKVTLYQREHWIAREKIKELTEQTMLCPCTVEWGGMDDA